MSTTKIRKTRAVKNPDNSNTDTATSAEPTADAGQEAATKSSKSDQARRVVSVNFPARTVRQLKLLASVEGVSIASIVVSSVTKTVAKRLPAALESIAKTDVEAD
jgi:hypothetical protein